MTWLLFKIVYQAAPITEKLIAIPIPIEAQAWGDKSIKNWSKELFVAFPDIGYNDWWRNEVEGEVCEEVDVEIECER